jgi:hypothetical protein
MFTITLFTYFSKNILVSFTFYRTFAYKYISTIIICIE